MISLIFIENYNFNLPPPGQAMMGTQSLSLLGKISGLEKKNNIFTK